MEVSRPSLFSNRQTRERAMPTALIRYPDIHERHTEREDKKVRYSSRRDTKLSREGPALEVSIDGRKTAGEVYNHITRCSI